MIEVTNAQTDQTAFIFPNKIFGITESKAMECTLLISGEGGQFPVKESKEEILKLIRKQKVTLTGGTNE